MEFTSLMLHVHKYSYTWFLGESDDDREELLDAANYACNPSCKLSFFKF